MSLDTAGKRKCVYTLPVLAGYPYPNSDISAFDRAHTSNMYCGIAVQVTPGGDWCPDRDSSPSWVSDSDNSDPWVKVQDQSRL